MEIFNDLELYRIVIYGALAGWGIFSIYYIIRARKKGVDKINPYVYDSIPNGFTTLGVLGTFLGIFIGLIDFDVNKITDSIPPLLIGLKTAFLTSILGIFFSFLFGKISQVALRSAEQRRPQGPTNSLTALKEINKHLSESRKETKKYFKILNRSLIGETDNSVSTHLVNLTRVVKHWIVKSMKQNHQLISNKFDEFSELLARNNTEALVGVMEEATKTFNAQMSALIERLVQENFQELNHSVQQMNTWQRENKEMITQLTNQFTHVVQDFETASTSIEKITDNTNRLTDENSHLTKLIKALQKVMIEDTKYQEIVKTLTSTIDTIKKNTDAFDETTNKLNNWVRNQMNFTDSVAKLLAKLERIEQIENINDVFWKNTKKQLNEGVSIIKQANERLSRDVENINEEFYNRLNDTLTNLDNLIQRIIADRTTRR